MKKKRNAVILMKKRNNYGKNVMVGTSGLGSKSLFDYPGQTCHLGIMPVPAKHSLPINDSRMSFGQGSPVT